MLLVLNEAEALVVPLQLRIEEIYRFKQNSLDSGVAHDFALEHYR